VAHLYERFPSTDDLDWSLIPMLRSTGWPGLRILAYVTGLINQELLLRCEYLAEENRILKEHIKGRLRLTDAERRSLAEIGHRPGRKLLKDVANVAKVDTILGWYHKLVAAKFDGSKKRRPPGRSRTDAELEKPIMKIAAENRWGSRRVVGALANLGYDPLPVYREHGETRVSRPDLSAEYPLTLITGGRIRQYYHSDFRQIESVRKLHPEPLMQLHPETAAKLGIADGDWAWIESPRGKVRMKVVLFARMKPDIVHAEHGWWLPELPEEEPWLHGVWESNSNILLADDPDLCNPITGAFPLKTNLCRVYKAKTFSRPHER